MPPPDPRPVHWRPAGWQITACGAPHAPAEIYPVRACCRTDQAEATCEACLSAVQLTPPAPAPVGYLQIGGRDPGLYITDPLALFSQHREWRARGWPGPHYDETDDCPCPDHRAMRANRGGYLE